MDSIDMSTLFVMHLLRLTSRNWEKYIMNVSFLSTEEHFDIMSIPN